MFVDDLVDLGHEAEGFAEGDDDFVVVGDVFGAEGAAFAVFEPFLADLVAADVEIPDGFGDALETAGACGDGSFFATGIDPHGVIDPADFDDFSGIADELGAGLVELGRFQQVHCGEFAAELGEGTEEVEAAGQGQARKINL